MVPAFIDLESEAPLPGREEDWSGVMEYRVRLALEERKLLDAERLQVLRVDWDRRRLAGALVRPQEGFHAEQKLQIRNLAASVGLLGFIQREEGRAECVGTYGESLALNERIGDKAGMAACVFNLGHAHLLLPVLRDLAEAERLYRYSLGLHNRGDRLGRGQCANQLGTVALERFLEAEAAGQTEAVLLAFLNEAAHWYHQALEFLPKDDVADIAVTHGQLGQVFRLAGEIDRALPHYRKAIRYWETQGNIFEAAYGRYQLAFGLASVGRFADALDYAEEALRGFESYGERAGADAEKTLRLIAEIQRDLPAGP